MRFHRSMLCLDLRAAAVILLGGASMAGVGCASAPAAEADAILGPTEAAFARPTGVLGALTAKDVLARAETFHFLNDSNQLKAFGGTPSGPAFVGGEYWQCVDVAHDSRSATTHLECATQGTTTGTMSWTLASEPEPHPGPYLWLEVTGYDDVCSRSGDICFSGKGAMRRDSTSTLSARELEITVDGGETKVIRSGSQRESKAGKSCGKCGSLSESFVIFDDTGRSYKLSVAPLVESGELTVTAANGSFACTYTDRGGRGRCADSAGARAFDW